MADMAQRRHNLQNFAPGMYKGLSDPQFGLWRLRSDGVWLFSVPVEGQVWRIARDQTGRGLSKL
jgi:hypothetical protein